MSEPGATEGLGRDAVETRKIEPVFQGSSNDFLAEGGEGFTILEKITNGKLDVKSGQFVADKSTLQITPDKEIKGRIIAEVSSRESPIEDMTLLTDTGVVAYDDEVYFMQPPQEIESGEHKGETELIGVSISSEGKLTPVRQFATDNDKVLLIAAKKATELRKSYLQATMNK